MIKVTVTSNVIAKLNAFTKDAPAIINRALADNARGTINEARSVHRHHTRTGNLRKSTRWTMDYRGNSRGIYAVIYYIDNGLASYGKWIHDGTRKWAADKYLYEAVTRNFFQAQRQLWATYKRLISSKGLS